MTHSLEVPDTGGGLRLLPLAFRILSEKCRRGKTIHSPPAPSVIPVKEDMKNVATQDLSWTCRSSIQGLESRKFCYEDGSAVFFWGTMNEKAAREKVMRARLTLDDGIAGDVQYLQRRTVFSQCVYVRPATKVVGGQSEGLYVNKSSEG